MATVTRTVRIKAPVRKVFEFVTAPENWTRYVTSLVNVRNLSTKKVEKGTTFNWTYRMLGMNFHGSGKVTALVKNRKFGLRMEGNFPIEETYEFTSVDGGTELTATIEYEMPGKIMSVLANNKLMEKMNRKEAEAVLAKVKMMCEEL